MSSRFLLAILVLATPVAACGGGLDLAQDKEPSDGGDSGETGSGDDGYGDGSYGQGQDASTTDGRAGDGSCQGTSCGSDGGDATVASDGAEEGRSENDAADGGICVPPDAAILTLPDLDTPCYFGATGQQLLAQVAPTYASTFTANGPEGFDAGSPWIGSLTPTALALTFTYSGGPVTCSPPPPPDCDPPGMCPNCGVGAGIVSLPLDVTFKTADGAFDEQFVATAWYGPGGQAEWGGNIPASQLHGTYPPVYSPNETVIFEGQLAGPSSDDGIVDELVPNWISGAGGRWP